MLCGGGPVSSSELDKAAEKKNFACLEEPTSMGGVLDAGELRPSSASSLQGIREIFVTWLGYTIAGEGGGD